MALAEANIRHLQSMWKHINSENISTHDLVPAERDLEETHFHDGYWQPYEYKWIEWIRFPRAYFDKRVSLTRQQDLSELEGVVLGVRGIEVTIDEQAVTIYGYRA